MIEAGADVLWWHPLLDVSRVFAEELAAAILREALPAHRSKTSPDLPGVYIRR